MNFIKIVTARNDVIKDYKVPLSISENVFMKHTFKWFQNMSLKNMGTNVMF